MTIKIRQEKSIFYYSNLISRLSFQIILLNRQIAQNKDTEKQICSQHQTIKPKLIANNGNRHQWLIQNLLICS